MGLLDGILGATQVFGGDLARVTGSSQKVVGLQGRPISAGTPTPGDVLVWTGTAWAPASTATLAPVVETGGDDSVVTLEFDLSPRVWHTNTGGSTAYTFDLGTSNFPPACRACAVVDWRLRAILAAATGTGGVGEWRLSSSFSASNVTGYLTLIGQSAVVPVDAGAHTHQPGTFSAASGGTRTHTVLLNHAPADIGGGTYAETDWILFAHVSISYYPGIA
jgi:hypothetical protein